MEFLIPAFSFHDVVIDPWVSLPGDYLAITLMGFFVTLACGLVGVFLIVRRLALVGDAVSHSLLPGIVLAFAITASRAPLVIGLGAILAGVVSVVLIELIQQHSRVKTDAALGIVFGAMFAIGVILLNIFGSKVDLDADCVLYGEIGFVPFADWFTLGGLPLGPEPVAHMGLVALAVIALIVVFYKELLVTSFDAGLAESLGIRPGWVHYGLMVLLAVAIVAAFESVGAILVIAMLIFPGATAALWSDRLPVILWLVAPIAAFTSLAGLHIGLWLDASIAGCMVVAAGFLFTLSWIVSPSRGLITLARRHLKASGGMARPAPASVTG
ncbi:MAG: metal ABC transporter permease [Opitutales bacterium]